MWCYKFMIRLTWSDNISKDQKLKLLSERKLTLLLEQSCQVYFSLSATENFTNGKL